MVVYVRKSNWVKFPDYRVFYSTTTDIEYETNENTQNYYSYIVSEFLHDFVQPDWCSTPVSLTLSAGSFDQTQICGLQFDSQAQVASFTAPTVRNPTCSDTSLFDSVINWSLRTFDLTKESSEYIKVSVDGFSK